MGFLKDCWWMVKTLFSSNPKEVSNLQLKETSTLPFDGYLCMMWCGHLVYRSSKAEKINEYINSEKYKNIYNHEMIHLCQAQIAGSWWKYYLNYVWEWIKGNPIINPASSAYYTIPYEMEAYGNEDDLTYTNNYDGSYLPIYDINHRKSTYKEHRSNWKEFCASLA
jgi:hypothetical protein